MMRNAEAARNATADAVTRLLDGGYLRLYSDPQPYSPDDMTSGTLLAELRFGAPAFERATNGQALANRIAPSAAAEATGEATWFCAVQSDGRTPVFDGMVGTGGDADLLMNNNNIQVNAIVSVSAFTYSVPVE